MQRVFSFIKNNCKNKVSKTKNISDSDKKLIEQTKVLTRDLKNEMNNQNLNNYMKSVINISFLTNKYINDEEPWKLKKNKDIKKVVICSGKVYFDLIEAREKIKNDQVYMIRIEQLYTFPVKTLAKELKRFKKNAEFYWCQEEPQNMGAWNTARNYIQWTLDYIKATNRKVNYIGRKPAASPASGYLKKHLAQQKEIIEKVLS